MWIFSILGFAGLTFAILLRIRETGPQGTGAGDDYGKRIGVMISCRDAQRDRLS